MPKNTEIRNILVVRTDRLGDVVLTTPALKALRGSFPDAWIAILVTPATRGLVTGNPYVNEVLIDDRKGVHRGPLGYARLLFSVRKKKFDVAVIFHTKKRSNLLCFLAGIPRRIGYFNEKFGLFLTDKIYDDRPKGLKHEAGYCLDLLKILGIEGDAQAVYVPIPDSSREWADKIFVHHKLEMSRPVFAFHPGSSCPTRQWPPGRFAELIERLNAAYGSTAVLIGADDTRAAAEDIRKAVNLPVIDLTGQTSVAQLAAFLKKCDLLVSNDSGPAHIAAGVGIPVVSIFTRNEPGINVERWKPLGPRSIAVVTPVKSGFSFAKGKVEDPAYLYAIGVENVMSAVESLLSTP